MKKILHYLTIDCIAFTVMMLVMSILSMTTDFVWNEFKMVYIFQFWIVITLICVLMSFTDRISVPSKAAFTAIQLADAVIVVMVVGGGIFQWFHWGISDILFVLAVDLLIYFVSYIIMMLKLRRTAEDINAAIARREKE